jgi:hypothetical protein
MSRVQPHERLGAFCYRGKKTGGRPATGVEVSFQSSGWSGLASRSWQRSVRCLRTSERGRKFSRRGECHLSTAHVDLLVMRFNSPSVVYIYRHRQNPRTPATKISAPPRSKIFGGAIFSTPPPALKETPRRLKGFSCCCSCRH